MPNRYSHAFVLNNYEKRGLMEATYQEQTYRYQTVHHPQSATSSSSPSISKPSSARTALSSSCCVPSPSTSKASPSRPPSSVGPQAYNLGNPSPLNLDSRSTTASPSSRTLSSVITQIYNPQTPRSYFESDSSQALQVTVARPPSATTELYAPLAPIPTSFQYLDPDYSLGSGNTMPRTSLDEVVLRDKLLDAIPFSVRGIPSDRLHEDLEDSDDDADGAIPPPIMRRRRDSSYTSPSISNLRPAGLIFEQRSIFRGTQDLIPRPSPATAQDPPPPPQPQPETQKQKLKKGGDKRSGHTHPGPPPLQPSRTDLNHEELQRWKNEVQQANWRRGNWVGALVGTTHGGWRERRRYQ